MATRTAVADGPWNSVSTWDTGVPVSGDIAVIPVGRIVTFNADQTGFASGVNVQIAGTLQMTTTPGTYLLKANANITGTGSLLAGTLATPLPSNVTMTFSFNGAFGINMTGGIVALYGAVKTLYRTTLVNAEGVGDTVLEVADNPTSWAAGDLIRVSDIAGTLADSEQRTILSTSATAITITAGLTLAKAVGSIITGISRNIKIVGGGTGTGINTINNGGLTLSNVEVRGFATNMASCTSANLTNCSVSGGTIGINVTTNMNDNGSDIVGNTTSINGGGGTYTNSWIVGSAGIASVGTLLLKSCRLYGLATALSTISVTAYNCIFSGNTTTLNSCHGTFIDCIFNSITSNASSIFGCKFHSCLFTGTEFNNYNTVSLLPHDYNESFDHNQISGDFRSWTRGGITSKNSSTLTTPRGTKSYQTALESATLPGFWQQEVAVEGGQRLSFTAWLRKSATMTTRPRVQVFLKGNDPLVTGAVPLSENIMTDGIDAWESFTVSLPNSSYSKTYIIRFQGQNVSGTMNSDLLLQRDVVTTKEFDMYLRTGDTASFSALYLDSATLLAKTGLTVTADLYRDGTQLVNDGAATEIGDGLYKYDYSSTSIAGIYRAVFKTTASGAVVNVMADRAQVGGWVDLLSAGDVTLLSPLTADGGTMTVEQGDDYKDVDGRAFNWTLTNAPSLTGGSGVWKFGTTSVFSKAVTILSSTSLRLELTRTETLTFKEGVYDFELEFTLANGDTVTPLEGRLLVKKNIG